MSINSKMS